jgi:hypothetical protein
VRPLPPFCAILPQITSIPGIFLFPFTEEVLHPVVILSGDERVEARKPVNGLLCVSLRGRRLGLHEVLLIAPLRHARTGERCRTGQDYGLTPAPAWPVKRGSAG